MKINEVLIYVILVKIYFVNLNRNINGRMFYYFIFRGSFLYNLVCFEFRCNVIVIFFFRDMFVFSGKVNIIWIYVIGCIY